VSSQTWQFDGDRAETLGFNVRSSTYGLAVQNLFLPFFFLAARVPPESSWR